LLSTKKIKMQIQNSIVPNFPISESQNFELNQITDELRIAYKLLNEIEGPKVTFYGGVNLKKDSVDYKFIFDLAKEFSLKGWNVLSGGGPGAMTASLEGAEAGIKGSSVGLRIAIANEPTQFTPDIGYTFQTFIARKYSLRQSDVMIYCPGSVGTMDELMENLDLLKTHKMDSRKIFLYNSKFWSGLDKFIKETIIKEWQLGEESIGKIYKIVDTKDEILTEVFGNTKI
jgi:uncharacterized protein (TIGR00730 family)